MKIWEILEISPSKDKKEIERAYNKKLGEVQGENKTEELREAYSKALEYAEDPKEEMKIMDLAISKKYENILSKEYWKDYHDKYEKTMGIIKSNLVKNLEKYINNYYFAIPKELLFYIVEKFNLFEKNIEKIKEYEDLPEFSIFYILNKSDKENIEFYRIRYDIYSKIHSGIMDLKELGEDFSVAEKIYNGDDDLKLLKVAFGLLKDIEKTKGDPLILNYSKKYFNEVEKNKKEIFCFFENTIEKLEKDELNSLDEKFYTFENSDYLPDYLSNFIKGYVKYKIGEYEFSYNYLFENNEIPKKIMDISKMMFINKYELLDNGTRSKLFNRKNFSIYDLIDNYKIAVDLDNWKNLLNDIDEDDYKEMKKIVADYLPDNFMIIPKKVVDYIYNYFKIDEISTFELTNEKKYFIKNMPEFDFSINRNQEHYKKKYEYYILSSLKDKEEEQEKYYKSLKTEEFDLDLELIRLQNIFTKDILSNLGEYKDFDELRSKIVELERYNRKEIEIYKIFLQSYDYKKIEEFDYSNFLKIDVNGLFIDEQVYNFILTIVYKIIGNEEKYEESKFKLSYFYNKAAVDVLVLLKKLKIKKKSKKGNNNYKTISIAVIITIVILFTLMKFLK